MRVLVHVGVANWDFFNQRQGNKLPGLFNDCRQLRQVLDVLLALGYFFFHFLQILHVQVFPQVLCILF